MTDKEVVQEIRAKLEELNDTLMKAYSRGIIVDIESFDVSTLSSKAPELRYTAKFTKIEHL